MAFAAKFLEDFDGVGDAAFEGVYCVYEERAVVGVGFGVGAGKLEARPCRG